MENISRGTAVKGVQSTDEETNRKIKIIIGYRWENMFEILTGEASNGYKRKNHT